MSNLYNLSDEELLQADVSTFVLDTEEVPPEEDNKVDLVEEPEQKVESPIINESGEQTTPDEETTEEVETETVNEDTSENLQTDTDSDLDYKQFYEDFTKPFKANGKEIQITNLEDAKSLMQQGANYSKKMAQLKPSMGILKTLEANGLLDENKLAYLIDLDKKNPEAIAKLVKESGIDLYSFDTDQADSYTPQSQVATYSDLEETINDLQLSSNEFPKVLNDAVNTWDDRSKQVLADKPEILRALTEHAELGLYDKIVAGIDYERMLGRLNGVSFLDAYSAIEGKFLQQQTNTPQQQAFTAPRPTNKPVSNQSNNEQKKKASTPSNTKNTTTTQTFDPLKVSDEEFLKNIQLQQYH